MHPIDEQYTRTPFYGSRKMVTYLGQQGYVVNRKRIQRLTRHMGLEAFRLGGRPAHLNQDIRSIPICCVG